jgi:hypothetical protein
MIRRPNKTYTVSSWEFALRTARALRDALARGSRLLAKANQATGGADLRNTASITFAGNMQVSVENPIYSGTPLPVTPVFDYSAYHPGTAGQAHSEAKIFEQLNADFTVPIPQVEGKLNLFSKGPICLGCMSIAEQFHRLWDRVDIYLFEGSWTSSQEVRLRAHLPPANWKGPVL